MPIITDALTVVLSEHIEDWWVIELANHAHTTEMRSLDTNTFYIWDSGRVSDENIEGTGNEMLTIALAILLKDDAQFRRCAIHTHSDGSVFLWSPRNSQVVTQVTAQVAYDLAKTIRMRITPSSE